MVENYYIHDSPPTPHVSDIVTVVMKTYTHICCINLECNPSQYIGLTFGCTLYIGPSGWKELRLRLWEMAVQSI